MNIYKLIETYLDFKNNYLTIQGYADVNGLSIEFTTNLINEARKVYISIYG